MTAPQPMTRDQREAWPEDVPLGTFDVVGGFLIFVCPRGQRCGIHVGPEQRDSDGVRPRVWKWDGNVERPTISPSINCEGGCGWHGHIENGVMR